MKKSVIAMMIALSAVLTLMSPAQAEVGPEAEAGTIYAWTQEEQESDVVTYEALPEIAPMEMELVEEQWATPVSLTIEEAFQEGRNIHEFSPPTDTDITVADKEYEDRLGHIRPGPLRVGLVRLVEPAPLSIGGTSALAVELSEGRKVWTLAIRSLEAHGIRVHFTNFDVDSGSLLVYAKDGEKLIVRGPYSKSGPNHNGDFWSASLPGDTVFIEVTGLKEPRLEIAELVHFDKDPSCADCGAMAPAALSCHLDVMCFGDPPISSVARQATGQMNFVSGGNSYVCTGTLLNDLDGGTYVPYFITAYHCLHTQSEVDTLEVVWLWQRPSCGGTLPVYSALPRSNGGTLLETNPSNDMTFIRLERGLPGGIGFAGWTTGHPSSGYGIHHPDGDWKRVTFLSGAGFCPLCIGCGDTANFDFFNMDDGIIEGGSSGSGVFNSTGQLAGQLYGSCCPDISCVGEELDCTNVDEFKAFYGQFDDTYSIIHDWLEIGGTIHVDVSNTTPPWLGTPGDPFRMVTSAYNFAWDGTRIMIQTGYYPESLIFSKELQLLANGGTVTIGMAGRISLSTLGTIKIHDGGAIRLY